jgi:hypothetical protein
LGEDELGAGKPGPVEHQVDRRAPPAAEQRRRLLDDLRASSKRWQETRAVAATSRAP